MRAVDLESSEWRAFLGRCEAATPFHHPAWISVLAETYGFRGFGLVSDGETDGIAEGLPVMEVALPPRRKRRWVSLPFTDHCPPLSSGAEVGLDFGFELDAAREKADVGQLEVRAPIVGGEHTALQLRALRTVLPLDEGEEKVFLSFHSSHRRSVRRALREGISVRAAETEADLADVFYRLHLLNRRRLGVPIQPRRYFHLLWRHVLEPGLGRLFLAYSGTHAVAGIVVLRFNRTAIYKYSALDPRARALRPNHLLVWRAIQWSIEGGAEVFDFGRTDIGQEGLRSFKAGWGAYEEDLTYATLGEPPSARRRQTPQLLGTAIRHSPPFVCRMLGELSYRFAA
jgi:CelD/BcsL family acetyltransferase involved in cellulose biosynthesis